MGENELEKAERTLAADRPLTYSEIQALKAGESGGVLSSQGDRNDVDKSKVSSYIETEFDDWISDLDDNLFELEHAEPVLGPVFEIQNSNLIIILQKLRVTVATLLVKLDGLLVENNVPFQLTVFSRSKFFPVGLNNQKGLEKYLVGLIRNYIRNFDIEEDIKVEVDGFETKLDIEVLAAIFHAFANPIVAERQNLYNETEQEFFVPVEVIEEYLKQLPAYRKESIIRILDQLDIICRALFFDPNIFLQMPSALSKLPLSSARFEPINCDLNHIRERMLLADV